MHFLRQLSTGMSATVYQHDRKRGRNCAEQLPAMWQLSGSLSGWSCREVGLGIMKKLTKRAEELLAEILEHRNQNGICDSSYWEKRFSSLRTADDAIIRSLFKELKDAEMISVMWADNYPYYMSVLANGVSYFEEINREDNTVAASYTNNFYAPVYGAQIQQGTVNSTQSQKVTISIDEEKLAELIGMIKKYDGFLDEEYGTDNARKVRESSAELEKLSNGKKDNKKICAALGILRDLSVNAGGGLIASGILQIVNMILGM